MPTSKISSSIHSKEIEELILGQSINFEGNLKKTIPCLKKCDFFFNSNKLIFDLVVSLSKDSHSISIIFLLEKAKKLGLYNDELPELLIRISQKNSLEIDILPYLSILREKSISRKIINFLNNSILELKDSILFPEKLLEQYKVQIAEIRESFEQILPLHRKKLRDILTINNSSLFEDIKKRFLENKKNNRSKFLKTGFDDLDSKTYLLNPSNLIILAARPAVGKTSFALNIAVNLAINNIPVGFFSLEMSSIQIAERIVSMLSKVSCENIKRGSFFASDLIRIENAEKKISSVPFFVFDYICSNISILFREIRKLKQEEDIQVIFIDYLQLLQSSKHSENRQGEVAEISRKLKLLAIELNIPIFCLSQLSRKVEERQDKRPIISDLRDSGQIEQDADVVMFLYNREQHYVIQNQESIKTIEVFLGKNRHGSLFSSFLNFESNFGSFEGINNEW